MYAISKVAVCEDTSQEEQTVMGNPLAFFPEYSVEIS